MCILVICEPECDVINFEINPVSNQAIFSTWPKSQDKNEVVRWNKKHFSSFLRAFMVINEKMFLEGESPTLHL